MNTARATLLVRTAQVAVDDPQIEVEPTQLFLCVFRLIAPTWPSRLWNYFTQLLLDVSTYSDAVFHPRFPIPGDFVVWTVQDDVKSVSGNIIDRSVIARRPTTCTTPASNHSQLPLRIDSSPSGRRAR